ncbi:MAG TPA: YdcF family protein [Candidatus Acidoferrales bacterium]|nr:YdcF family protein [Candidatus Acidoferrales bacterium]
MKSSHANQRRSILLWAVCSALICFISYIAVISCRIVRQAHSDEARPADAIVVFGAAEYAGRPSPIYRARLDHAAELYARKFAPVIITSGGSGGDPRYTEGEVGHDYLLAKGVRDAHLIAETQGDNSAESAERVANIMRVNGWNSCIVVSDPYHLYRAKRLLQSYGFVVYASGRRVDSPAPVEFNAARVAREALSYSLWRLHLIRR